MGPAGPRLAPCWPMNLAIRGCFHPMVPNISRPLQWHHNERDGVSNHQPHDCLLNRLLGRRSKKTSKLRVTGLCLRGIHRWPVNSSHKGPVTRKMFPFDDVIMLSTDCRVRHDDFYIFLWFGVISYTFCSSYDILRHDSENPSKHPCSLGVNNAYIAEE